VSLSSVGRGRRQFGWLPHSGSDWIFKLFPGQRRSGGWSSTEYMSTKTIVDTRQAGNMPGGVLHENPPVSRSRSKCGTIAFLKSMLILVTALVVIVLGCVGCQ
jgi:hypothetical protein